MNFRNWAGRCPVLSQSVLGVAASLMIASPALAQDVKCELDRPVVFADLDWDSNAVHTAIARFIMEKGYGCQTDAIPGTTIPLLNGQIRGDTDVTMEIWRENYPEIYDPAVEEGKIIDLGVNFPDAIQGWFVSNSAIEGDNAPAAGLKSVEDLPRYKDVFTDPEEPGKGRFYNGPSGWAAENISTKKLHGYDLTDSYVNFRSGTGAALAAAVESAILRNRPILFYYWGPTWLLGKVGDQVTMLEEPAFDQAIWDKMQDEEDPENVTEAVAFPVIKVTIAGHPDFVAAAPKLVEFLKAYETTGDQTSRALAWMEENNASADDAAVNFLRNNKTQWHGWVPEDVAARVDAAL